MLINFLGTIKKTNVVKFKAKFGAVVVEFRDVPQGHCFSMLLSILYTLNVHFNNMAWYTDVRSCVLRTFLE